MRPQIPLIPNPPKPTRPPLLRRIDDHRVLRAIRRTMRRHGKLQRRARLGDRVLAGRDGDVGLRLLL